MVYLGASCRNKKRSIDNDGSFFLFIWRIMGKGGEAMVYFFCPHCKASLYIPLEWGQIACPFCGGIIVFQNTVILEWRGEEKEIGLPKRNSKIK